ncbi:MAG: PadR family transcriptional regulator [Deltaproteobacteria bacterium]|nr:MAG: PadR family transcriptional regulator [Deltaproteobacteria bacterium]
MAKESIARNLMLLGLLKDGPKHGYEIKKLVDEVMSGFTGISSQSIYYPLKELEKKGFLTKTVGRSGKRPEKYVYSITEKGEEEFGKLLSKNLLIIQRPYLNLDLSLYFLHHAKPEAVKRRLASRLNGLRKVEKWIVDEQKNLQKNKSLHHMVVITEHMMEMIKLEINFTQRLLKQFT